MTINMEQSFIKEFATIIKKNKTMYYQRGYQRGSPFSKDKYLLLIETGVPNVYNITRILRKEVISELLDLGILSTEQDLKQKLKKENKELVVLKFEIEKDDSMTGYGFYDAERLGIITKTDTDYDKLILDLRKNIIPEMNCVIKKVI